MKIDGDTSAVLACPRCGPTTARVGTRGYECGTCGRLLATTILSPVPAKIPDPTPLPGSPQAAAVPFVTGALDVVWLTAVPADLLCLWLGPAAAWRLTPAVYAHLFHVADRKAAEPGTDPAQVAELLLALDRVYAALVTRYDPADVHAWTPALPPLPELPRVPQLDGAIAGPLPAVPAKYEPARPVAAEAVAAPRSKSKRSAPAAAGRRPGDKIATGRESAGMYD